MGPDRFTGRRRIIRLAILRAPLSSPYRSAPLVGAFSHRVWPSHTIGHRHSRGLLLSLPGGRLLRLLLRTVTNTEAHLRRLGLALPPLPPPLPLSRW